MSTRYRVYGNGGSGGPVDYSTPLQDSASLTFSYATIPPGDWSFAVRAYDSSSGLSEYNTDATTRVVIGADHLDHTAIPNHPSGLTVVATSGGRAKLDFHYASPGQAGAPTTFRAWLWSGAVDWSATPSATLAVMLHPGEVSRAISISLSGLSSGVNYTVGVRAANAAGDDGNTTTATVVGKSGSTSVVGTPAGSAAYPAAG